MPCAIENLMPRMTSIGLYPRFDAKWGAVFEGPSVRAASDFSGNLERDDAFCRVWLRLICRGSLKRQHKRPDRYPTDFMSDPHWINSMKRLFSATIIALRPAMLQRTHCNLVPKAKNRRDTEISKAEGPPIPLGKRQELSGSARLWWSVGCRGIHYRRHASR